MYCAYTYVYMNAAHNDQIIIEALHYTICHIPKVMEQNIHVNAVTLTTIEA